MSKTKYADIASFYTTTASEKLGNHSQARMLYSSTLSAWTRHDQIILFGLHVNSGFGLSDKPRYRSDWRNLHM